MDENNQMKVDLESKCDQILKYKLLCDEYSDKLEQEMETVQILQEAVGVKSKSVFESQKSAQMQELIKHLSIQVAQQNAQIVSLKS